MKKRLVSFIPLFLLISCMGISNGKIEATGTIEIVETNVSAKNSDDVIEILSDEGDWVNQGDTLAVIDHSLLDLQLKQYEAQVDVAKAQLQLLLKGARVEDLKIAEEAVLQAKTNFEDAEKDMKRLEDLFNKGNIPEKQYEDGKNRFILTKAQYNSAVLNLDKLKKGAREEEINSARAQYNQSLAVLDIQKKRIEDCFIKSPVNGIVTDRLVEVGEFVNVGTPLFVVSKTDTANLTIYVTEPELGKIKIGQQAKIRIDTYSNRDFIGKIIYISPNAEFTPKNIQTKEDRVKQVFGVKISIPNDEMILKAGMPADAYIK